MVQRNKIVSNLDWLSILLWVVMMAFGWMNIYSANIMEADGTVFDISQRFGKQLIWIGASILLALLLLVLDAKFYIYFSYLLYVLLLGVLLAVLIFGREINGAKSWFVIGGFQLQPAEFAKPVTALALANLLTSHNYHMKKFWHLVKALAIIGAPPMLILLQPDLGSVLVYAAFILVLFREGFFLSLSISKLLFDALPGTIPIDHDVHQLEIITDGLLREGAPLRTHMNVYVGLGDGSEIGQGVIILVATTQDQGEQGQEERQFLHLAVIFSKR